MKRFLIFILGFIYCQHLFITNLSAATFGAYDPRSLAMGGTGVSQASIDHAAYYNPALLSIANEDDDFSLLIPTVGANVSDPGDVIDALQDHQDGKYETVLSDSVDTFAALPSMANAQRVADNAQRLLNSFTALSDKGLDLELHAGVGLAVPGKSLGIGVIASGRAMGGAILNIATADRVLMEEYIEAARDFAADGIFNGSYPNAVCGTNFCTTKDRFDSRASIRGALILEGGLSLSHEFASLDNWAVGITPKMIQVTTFDDELTVEDSEIDEDKGKLEYDDTNIDVGIARRFGEKWKFGMVVKNALKKEYRTVLGNTIMLEPMVRAGISHHTDWTTIALDMDLTENDRIGLIGEKTRYVAIGTEFDLSFLQLRLGVRHNLSAQGDRDATLLSAGVGIYIFGFHIDAGAAKNDDEMAAAAQIGLQF